MDSAITINFNKLNAKQKKAYLR